MSRSSTVARDDAFQTLLGRELPRLVGLARSLTGDLTDADDLVQETLAKAIRHWDRVSASGAPGAYLRRMMTNAFISAGRRRWGREVISHQLATEGPVEAPVRTTYTDPDLADREEMLSLLRLLPRQQRAVLALRYYDDMTFAQVARTLGCTEGAARAAASRGLSALRAHLDGEPRAPADSSSPRPAVRA